MDEDDDELDEKTFICIECGMLCPEDEWNMTATSAMTA